MAKSIVDPGTCSDDKVQAPVYDLRSSHQARSETVAPVVEEVAIAEKQEVVTGRVRVRTITDTVEELAHAELQQEDVEVTRVPVDKILVTTPGIRTDGDVTIIPVVEEVLVVEKRSVLKEELHTRRPTATKAVEVLVTPRKQRAIVERETPEGLSSGDEASGGEPDNAIPR